ncbi:cytochrome P450 [Lenzites betulinus]|nr:cytochrome P450 [Lenzites betulinus]
MVPIPVFHVVAPVSAAAFAFVLLRLAFAFLSSRASPKNINIHGKHARARQTPPGPRALPVLGNVHQLPMDYQQRTFGAWAAQYGDVVYAKLFARPVLVLNSLRAAHDLLEKRSARYSDRPRLILLAELMGWDSVVTHMSCGERFRKHRRWMHDNFQTRDALLAHRAVQHRETCTLLAGLLATPDAFEEHIHRWAVGTIMDITYGHRIHSLDDEYVALARNATVETVLAGSPGSMLVDFFPILKSLPTWAPGAGFKRNALKIRGLVRALLDVPYAMVKASLANGTARPSFTATLLEDVYRRNGLTPEEEEDIKGAAGVIYAAGTDTTVTVLSTFFLAMVRHPDAFRRAQAELDAVVGRARLPDEADRENLPYLEALLMEVYRWECPVPLAIPHHVSEEDVYRGYRIPANTMVIPNIWNMTQDPTLYPEPQAFRPERWLEMDAATAAQADPRRFVFGFGRRVCPGRDFADAGVWLAMACVIALFDVGKAVDAYGHEITPPPEFTSGFVRRVLFPHPKPFACAVRPRGDREKAAEIIAQARAALAIEQ